MQNHRQKEKRKKIPPRVLLVVCSLLFCISLIFTFTLLPPKIKDPGPHYVFKESRAHNLFTQTEYERYAYPYFLIIGAPNCGTTSLFRYLAQHPQVVLPMKKELKFFGRERLTIQWYLEQFPFVPVVPTDDRITGEATPTYLQGKGDLSTPLRAFSIVPKAKLIVMLRDPVEAAISYWTHLRHNRNWRDLSLERTLELSLEELQLCREGKHPQVSLLPALEEKQQLIPDVCFSNKLGHNLLTFPSYVHGVRRWLSVYPREQFYFIDLSQFANNTKKEMKSVNEFLEIGRYDYTMSQLSRVFNKNEKSILTLPITDGEDKEEKEVRQDLEKIKERLRVFFHPYNQQLYELLGVNYNWSVPSSTPG